MIVAYFAGYLIPPMPLYSAIYKTANHDGDIILRASGGTMIVSFVILVAGRHRLWPAAGNARREDGPRGRAAARVALLPGVNLAVHLSVAQDALHILSRLRVWNRLHPLRNVLVVVQSRSS